MQCKSDDCYPVILTHSPPFASSVVIDEALLFVKISGKGSYQRDEWIHAFCKSIIVI